MADLLVEIRTEELPPRRVREAAAALRDGLAARLAEAGLLEASAAEKSPVLGTTRRLAAWIPGIKEAQINRPERLWGPPVAAAFGPDGAPTKAGEGFARASGVALPDMGRGEKVPGKPPYLYADRTVRGRTAAAVIAEALPAVAAALPFRRTMRWPRSPVPFARPVRGLVVLLGAEVVPCSFAGVEAGRTTRGHAFLRPKPLDLGSADLDGYRGALRKAKVIVDLDERAKEVRRQVQGARRRALAGVRPGWTDGDADLLEEVAGLVEWPRALTGAFDERYARLPPALLVTSMAHHLRFFPVLDAAGTVLPAFVSVTDRDARHAPSIRGGNERVLRARLYDADFFFGNDRKRRLEEFRPGLAGMDFHRGLGSLLDKSKHVEAIAVSLCDTMGLAPEQGRQASVAAVHLKDDLLTEVVKEFPELQGVVGRHYAALDGIESPVPEAIVCQYLPRTVWEPMLDDPVVAAVSLAEKADTLAAYFSVGEEPTGAADPYGLRRHALGLLWIIGPMFGGGPSEPFKLSIENVLDPACLERKVTQEARKRVIDFVWARAVQVARTEGFTDFIDVVGAFTSRPFDEYATRLRTLDILSKKGTAWRDLVALVERTGNMGAEAKGGPDMGALPPEGRIVARAFEAVALPGTQGRDPVAFAGRYLAALGGPVQGLFEKVLVEDPAKPAQTAALKHLLFECFHLFADRLGDLRRLGSGAKPPRA